MDSRGLRVPKSDDSLISLSIGTPWHTSETTPLAHFIASWIDGRRRLEHGALKAQEIDNKQ